MKLLRDLFMGPNNANWDLGRFMSAASLVSLISAQGHALAIGQQFEVMNFGLALAAVLGGAGAFIALKDGARTSAASAAVKDEAVAATTAIVTGST